MTRPTMVFHAPYPLDPNPTAASRLRPLRMRQAFEEIGYDVVDVSGTTTERRSHLRRLRSLLSAGALPEFLYSENSTQPNVLATSLRTGVAPALDYRIMRTARRAGIPLGLFYRDAYWRTPLGRTAGLWGLAGPWLQRLDLVGYRRNRVHFFLPSRAMSTLVGLAPDEPFSALPPGCEPGHLLDLPAQDDGLRLLYVGGLGGHYVLDGFLEALASAHGVHLDLVTRPDQWRAALAADPGLGRDDIAVHHRNANELLPLYKRAHVGVLAVRPSEYRDIAVPVKLFEYVSYGRPVIATRGTEAGRIVEHHGAGWVVEHDVAAMTALLTHLRDHPEEVDARAAAARRMAQDNTWAHRAREVSTVLRKRNPRMGL